MGCARGGGGGDFLREAISLALRKNRNLIQHLLLIQPRPSDLFDDAGSFSGDANREQHSSPILLRKYPFRCKRVRLPNKMLE